MTATQPITIRKIGVIGAGQIGCGIAHVCAVSGFDVYLVDISTEALERARSNMTDSLDHQVSKGKISEATRRAALDRISTGTGLTLFSECDLVIEAVTENEEIKRQTLKSLGSHLKPEALIATCSSSIPITRLAARTDRPQKFMGMHFMNPVPPMQLVELIRGIATDDETFEAVQELTGKLGKIAVKAEDFPAFIVNRILLPMINEAVYTLYEGIGSVETIDTAMKLGANHPMGPLELADFIGLDTCFAVMTVLYDGLGDEKYRPCPLLVKYVEAGWIGRKAGKGFYDYTETPPRPTR
jgi:3-hydroxybutyryl-CoA dehydrogenase